MIALKQLLVDVGAPSEVADFEIGENEPSRPNFCAIEGKSAAAIF